MYSILVYTKCYGSTVPFLKFRVPNLVLFYRTPAYCATKTGTTTLSRRKPECLGESYGAYRLNPILGGLLQVKITLCLTAILCLFITTTNVSAATAPDNVIWVDLPANARVYTDQAAVDSLVRRIATANIDGIVLDVKAYTGYTAYPSAHAPHISQTKIPNHSGATEGFDLLQAFVDATRQWNVKLYASINTFSEGNVRLADGPLFTNELMRDWSTTLIQGRKRALTENGLELWIDAWNQPRLDNQLVLYTRDNNGLEFAPTNTWGVEVVVLDSRVVAIVDRVTNQDLAAPKIPEMGFVLSGSGRAREALLQLSVGDELFIEEKNHTRLIRAEESSGFTGFVNPIHPEVKQYILTIIQEILEYDIDGLVLDRARYANVLADFSPLSRNQFQAFLGEEIAEWPRDVLEEKLVPGGREVVFGRFSREWFHWRARNIQRFFAEVEQLVRQSNPDLAFGVYVGSWYNHYYAEGVNWGRKGFQPDLDWVSPTYHETGYADLLDFLMAGTYYYEVTAKEAEDAGLETWRSVEGGLDLVEEAVHLATRPLGSLYLLDYGHNLNQFKKAVRMIQSRNMGVMLFDVYYIEQYDWWAEIKSLLE